METIEIPKNALALYRLPIAVSDMTAICNLHRDKMVEQRGEWLVVLPGKQKEGKPS